MIGFNALGRMGRLCNQMFQYAALKGLAKNAGAEITIPYYEQAVDDGMGNMLRTELFDSFDLNVKTGLLNNGHAPVVNERFFHFDEELFNNCPDHVSLQGYFQTEKYFKHIEQEIREDFKFKDDILIPCQEMMDDFGEPPLSLHIRRGDFLKNSGNHHNLGLDYYDKALAEFPTSVPVLIFSDDPEWCGKQEIFGDDRFLIAEGNSSYVDLCLMSLCEGHIIANSTFSWWGAWLADSKMVVAPSVWFGPNNAHLDIKDLYLDHWEII